MDINGTRFNDNNTVNGDPLIFRPQINGTDLDDTINALAGNDIVWGNGGNDNILGGDGNDIVWGNGGNDNILGGNGNDTLEGGDGNDTVDAGVSGSDTLRGGLGNDTYIVTGADDTVIENLGAGVDTVVSSGSFELGANVENLTLLGSGWGWGNELDNVITGSTGNDTLDGISGFDTLIGGAGNDTYIVTGISDTLIENPGAGVDTVVSSSSFTLGANVENLTLTGGSGTGTGNELNNVITGSAGYDTLDGVSGSDTLIGGLSNDTYIVGADDTVIENPGAGVDTVVSGSSLTLGANVENLTLTGSGRGTGNQLDNVITGSTGNDTLDGVSGSDTLIGGLGNDTYIVTGADDTVIENPGAGVDTVVSSGSFRLGDNVENLILTGSGTGTGNGLDNVITGSIGDDFLSGGYGGAGDEDIALGDTLNGGRGNDTLLGDEMFTKGGNDVLNGGAGNDILDAGRSRGRQFDTLTGGTEADIFALGLNDSGLPFITDYYLGDGHATITDFSVSAGDKINVHGSSSDYTLTLGNTGGNDAAQDTLIELNGDLIGIVLDVDLTNSAGQVFI